MFFLFYTIKKANSIYPGLVHYLECNAVGLDHQWGGIWRASVGWEACECSGAPGSMRAKGCYIIAPGLGRLWTSCSMLVSNLIVAFLILSCTSAVMYCTMSKFCWQACMGSNWYYLSCISFSISCMAVRWSRGIPAPLGGPYSCGNRVGMVDSDMEKPLFSHRILHLFVFSFLLPIYGGFRVESSFVSFSGGCLFGSHLRQLWCPSCLMVLPDFVKVFLLGGTMDPI